MLANLSKRKSFILFQNKGEVMQFLIDEDLPRSTGNLLRRYEHEAIDVRDIGL